MRKVLSRLMVAAIVVFSLFGCQSKPEREKKTEESSEPLLIFVGDENKDLIKIFQVAHPEIEIETKNINGTIDDFREKYGEPDIILDGTTDLQYRYEKGDIADLTQLYEEDEQFDSNQYFKGVIEAGRSNGMLLALPLSISIPYMTIEESKWYDSAFALMPEEYEAMDLLLAMNVELDKAEGREDYLVFGKEYVYIPEWLWSIGAIKEEETGMTIDPEVFKAVYTMQLKLQENKLNNDPLVERFYLPYSPSVMEDTYLAVSFGYITAPQTGLILENCIYKEYNGESVKAIWRPTIGENKCYIAQTAVMGMVGANSDQKQEAYEVLRMMMDMPISEWAVSTGHFVDNTLCPVHIENAKSLIETVETTGQEFFLDYEPNTREEMYNVPKEPLSEELKSEIWDVLDHIEVKRADAELMELLQECVKLYLESNSPDYERCYQDVMNVINSYYN